MMPSFMRELALPRANLCIRESGEDGLQVYDPLRKRWIALTPEEYVRQSFVAYLTDTMGYPSGRLGNEVSLIHNGMARRCDTVIYGSDARPLAIVEYKSPDIKISRTAFNQILRYSIVLENRFIFVSNGLTHYCAEIVRESTSPSLKFLDYIPSYSELTA